MNVILEFVVTLFVALFHCLKAVIFTVIPAPKKSVEGEIVLITGAGSGLGRLMCLQFAKRGATIVAWDVNQTGNEETAEQVKHLGAKVYTYTCDISKREDVYAVADKVRQDVGDVTILVNNAGIVTGKKFMESSDVMIQKTMEVNALSHFWTIKSFVPVMIEKNHGHVVALSSMLGVQSFPQTAEYSASKAAILRIMESLSQELRQDGSDVKTSTVVPFMVDTGLFRGAKTIKAFLPTMMRNNSGHVVCVASMAGIIGCNVLVDYCSSKFANVGMMESLTLELWADGHTGIKTTTVCPYFIDTGMFDGCQTRFPFILPVLEPESTVDTIMNAILTNQEIVYIPRIMYIFNFLKSILSIDASRLLARFMGATTLMEKFRGRQMANAAMKKFK